ncbi:MAG: TonB-dependent receptor, partial [Bacteroidales bacterium]|nr:TonB-dependent receptor [Bacteroidales bacterium]
AVSTINAVNSGGRAEAGLTIGRSELSVGVDYEHVTKDGDRVKSAILQPTLPVFTEQIWSNALISNLGSFVEYRASVLWLDFIAACRVDLNNANSDDRIIEKMGQLFFFNDDNKSNYTNFSFSAGLDGQLDEIFSLGLMVGRGVRSPDMIERFITLLPVGYDKYDYLGNPALLPEKNLEVDLTLRMKEHTFGSLELNGFYSKVTNFITGKIIPPAQQKPLSQDVIGVKQFYNADKAWFRGLELSYHSPKNFNPKVNFTAAYTKGTISSATRHIFNENNEVIGTEVITNDALSEIPPFEAWLSVLYKLLDSGLTPGASLRMVAAQDYVSAAFYEPVTPGFLVAGLTLSYEHNEMLKVTGGVANIFNSLYYEHLNRRIIGSRADFYEPGRNFFVNIIITL